MQTLTIEELVKNNINIFNFDYELEIDKDTFEKHFIEYFYFREIGSETIARFIHNLKVTFNEHLPLFNELCKTAKIEYDVVNNYDVTEKIINEGTGNSTTTLSDTTKGRTLDTPQGKLELSKEDKYVTELQRNDSESTSSSNNTTNGTMTRTMKGNIGVMTASDLLTKHIELQKILRKLELDFFENVCDELFLSIW